MLQGVSTWQLDSALRRHPAAKLQSLAVSFRSRGHPRAGTQSRGLHTARGQQDSWCSWSLPGLLMRCRSSISMFHCCSSSFCCFILEGTTEVMSYCSSMPQGWTLLILCKSFITALLTTWLQVGQGKSFSIIFVRFPSPQTHHRPWVLISAQGPIS